MNTNLIVIALTTLAFNSVDARSTFDDSAHAPIKREKTELFEGINKATSEDKAYWLANANADLQATLAEQLNTNVAKNVIMFLGDGMGISTITASRIYVGQKNGTSGEEGYLSYDNFPHVGLIKTYNVDVQVPDSAGTANAFLTGVKTNMGLIGYDANVVRGDCASITNSSLVHSIAKWSQDKGKRTGFVTSTRITHATPAILYAHAADRDFECDSALTQGCESVKDIARQLVEDEPGKKLNVIMGGGFGTLDKNTTNLPGDPAFGGCRRSDDRNLWQTWLNDRAAEGKTAAFVRTRTELSAVDLINTEFLMGIYANSHVPYEYEKRQMGLDLPTLAEMTEAAITVLSQEPNGFFLMVEGGRIDHGHHANQGVTAMDEAMAMDDAVWKALQMTNNSDTLIVVTADHSHTLTMDGYPLRGTNIAGLAGADRFDLPYTTLSYANGPGYDYSVVDGKVRRGNLTGVDTTAYDFQQQATVELTSETHGGEDVAVYAFGPMSHLFTSVHEQNYIAVAMAYASCVDPVGQHCLIPKFY